MTAGRLYPRESSTFLDPSTDILLRQVTSHPSIHHHPFYYLPCYDDAMQRLIFVSHRTGTPQLFAELQDTQQIVQLTAVQNLNEWSVHPSHDGRYVYFTAGSYACRADCQTQRVETLLALTSGVNRESGMVAAAMGTTSLSHDDRYWAVPVKIAGTFQLYIIDTADGSHRVICQAPVIAHPEFHPNDNNQLRYAGPHTQRMWIIRRDGSDHRLVYRRDEAAKEWIVHETWLPHTRELLVTRWPHGMIAVHVDTGAVRPVCSFNAWHTSVNRQGTLMCADTAYPDTGLHLFNPLDNIGQPHLLCLSQSSNQGTHWHTDHCPYDDRNGPRPGQVYAPQHTHPHPAFSPDGKIIVFTSDRTGFSQVYEVSQVPYCA